MNSVALPSSIPACAGRAPQVAARQQAAGSRPQAHTTRLQATPRSSAATAAAAASAVSSPLVAAAGASVTVEKLGADVWNTTYYPKAVDHVPTEKTWYLVDAKGQRLGRMATLIATYLRGANAPTYTPSVDMGSYVVVVNVEQVQVTGRKRLQKQYVRHTTGRPGGMMVENFEQLQKRLPARIVEEAVWGMIPKERLGRHLFTHLKCYKGDKHPHSAQQPVDITHLIAERCMP